MHYIFSEYIVSPIYSEKFPLEAKLTPFMPLKANMFPSALLVKN